MGKLTHAGPKKGLNMETEGLEALQQAGKVCFDLESRPWKEGDGDRNDVDSEA